MFFSPFQKDPLKDAVLNVMKKNQTIRETEKGLLNDLKIQSEKQIPHELLSEYKSVLAKRTNAALNEDVIDVNAVDKSKNYKEDETQETDMGDRKRTSREKAKQLLAGIVKKKLNEKVSLPGAREKWAKKMEAHGWLKTSAQSHDERNQKREAGLKTAKDNWAKEMEKTSPDEIKQKVSTIKRIKDNFRRSMEDTKRKPRDTQAASDKAGVKKIKAGFAKAMAESLGSNASTSDYIHDFVHSKNSMFKGDSKKERINRALGAYYAKH